MIAITVIVNIFIFSMINCQQWPLRPGLPQSSFQETNRQRFPLSNISPELFGYDYDTSLIPNMQEFGSSTDPNFSFREPSSWPKLPSDPFNYEDFAANFKRVSSFRPQVPLAPAVGPGFGSSPLINGNEASNVQRLTGQTYLQPFPRQFPRSFRSIESFQRLENPEPSGSSPTSFKIPEFEGVVEPIPSLGTIPSIGTNPSLGTIPSIGTNPSLGTIPSLGFQNSKFLPQLPQISQLSDPGFAVPSIPTSATTPPSFKAPRSIPSPLAYIDSIPLSNSYDDPFTNMFDTPSSILTSSVGCLQLTVTPYGTISETPLPDPSIPLPRGPFLPIASPVSAFAPPLSPFLPSASPAAKGTTFLRKVPVPPPFI